MWFEFHWQSSGEELPEATAEEKHTREMASSFRKCFPKLCKCPPAYVIKYSAKEVGRTCAKLLWENMAVASAFSSKRPREAKIGLPQRLMRIKPLPLCVHRCPHCLVAWGDSSVDSSLSRRENPCSSWSMLGCPNGFLSLSFNSFWLCLPSSFHVH